MGDANKTGVIRGKCVEQIAPSCNEIITFCHRLILLYQNKPQSKYYGNKCYIISNVR